MARGLKFWIQIVEGLYYLCSENKGADQLRGYREADLRLCFCICKKNGFLMTRLTLCVSDFFQKADPAQFVRAYGRPCKINLDPAVAIAAEGPQST